MFYHKIEPFGTFEKHVFSNDKGDAFSVVPQFGACLLDLQFNSRSVLDGYSTPEELIENKWSKNIILLPYPNRLRDGQYVHVGKTYQFDLNNPSTQNSLHGFGANAPMRVDSAWQNNKEAGIKCSWRHNGTHAAYPFPFTAEITMILRASPDYSSGGGKFDMTMAFTNDGDAEIPVGLGWHPYFKMSEKSDDSSLRMPDCQFIHIDDRMLPTGEKTPFKWFKRLTPIKNNTLDNGFYINDQTKNAETVLASEHGRLTFWQETGHRKWNFLQVFTPPHRKSVAIEPMTCNIDAFNNGDGLVMLKPSESLSGSFGVRFKKK
jgi:aldose 1-epimerase